MQSRTVLAPLTIFTFVVTGVVVASHMMLKPAAPIAAVSETLMDAALGSTLNSPNSVLAMSKTLLMTGVSPTVPEIRTLPVLRTVPWGGQELGREFRRAGSQLSCSLIEPALDVFQPLIAPTPGTAGPIGRQTAFSLNLEVDPAAKATLPRVARGAIESYLESHQLSIQAVYYHTVDGKPFFGPQVRAAFIDVATPQKTVEPESMIVESIKELRTLGLYWENESALVPEKARTLVLAFRYSLETHVAGSGKSASNQEYELLFLHLMKDSTATAPKLAVFATSNGRNELNLLENTDPLLAQQKSVIAARVRFSDFNMMGMYPANPIVTGVFHQSKLSLPVESIKALLEGIGAGKRRSLSDVLDDLNRRAITGDTSDIFSAPPEQPDQETDPDPTAKEPTNPSGAAN